MNLKESINDPVKVDKKPDTFKYLREVLKHQRSRADPESFERKRKNFTYKESMNARVARAADSI